MKITISKLTSHAFDMVDDLMKRYSRTLGFLPREALLNYLERGGVLGAKTGDGELIGYLLYADYPDRFRIVHLCVSENFRSQGIARQLVDALKESATTQKVIKLRCRRDFPGHAMWPKLGFVPLDEKPGRSSSGHRLTLWYLTLASDDQLSLFQAKTSDETLDVVIDAHILFDFDEPDSDKTKPSQALIADFLVDSLNLWITDELFVEIDRNDDHEQRTISRNRAHEFSKIEHNSQSAKYFEENLKKFLPYANLNQQSDIRQLAKTAASDVKIFVTRDQDLLKKAAEISNLTNLQVLSPTELIIQLHELSERQSYISTRVSGVNLEWRRLTSDYLASFPFSSFLNQGERQGKFREKLEAFLASPDDYECDLLWSGDEPVAIRVLENGADKVITVHLSRVAPSANRSLFECFLVSDIVYKAVKEDFDMVKFEKAFLAPSLIPHLLEAGFIKCNDNFVRFCFARCLDRGEVLSTITGLCSEAASSYQDMSDIDLERYCSPLGLESADQKYFLIPVRPGYAMSLVDRHRSSDDLFGGKISVLLRWDNIYYRSKTHHKILKPPARILWYVTEDQKQIAAVSHLDDVVIDTPKMLFKKFNKFGILEWKDLYEMCDSDLSKEIMALKFSHTFPFRKPVSLDVMKTVFKEDEAGLILQSPLKIPMARFQKLFQLGYPDQP